MNEDIKKDGNIDNNGNENGNEIDINDLNNVNGGAYQGSLDPNHRRN